MNNSLERIEQLVERFRIETVRDVNDTVNIRYGVLGSKNADYYVIFLNGRTEWVEKYAYLPDDLELSANTTFVAVDHRGQGGSGGARSYVDSYDTYASDLREVVQKVTNGKPYAVVAHSMGGLIGLYATITGKIKPECLVLSSPLLGLPDQPVPRQIAKPLSRLLDAVGLGNVSSGGGNYSRIAFEHNKLTHDIDLYRRMQESPYKIPGATFGWVTATFDAIDVVFDSERLKNFHTPTLLMVGSEEKVVDPEAIRKWVAINVDRSDLTVLFRLISGGKHELLSEIPKYYEQALRHVRKFLDEHFFK